MVPKSLENCPRAAIDPESHAFPSPVDVCAMESVLVQVTVVPTAMSRLAGLKARFPRVDAPVGIEIDDPDTTGVGTGVGDGDGDGAE